VPAAAERAHGSSNRREVWPKKIWTWQEQSQPNWPSPLDMSRSSVTNLAPTLAVKAA
jgi:hypothetical protein